MGDEIGMESIHYSTEPIHISTECIGDGMEGIGVSTECIGVSTECIGVSTECIGVSTECIGVSTECIGVSTECIGVSTECIGVSTECSGYGFLVKKRGILAIIYMTNQEKVVINDEFVNALQNYLSEGNKEFTPVSKKDISITTMKDWDNNNVDAIMIRREFLRMETSLLIEKVYLDSVSDYGMGFPKIKDGKFNFESIQVYYPNMGNKATSGTKQVPA